MKNLRFEKLELVSRKERKARKIEFHPRLTVIMGTNDVGKSSVIKSLYWAFGAAPIIIHPNWAEASIKALVTFCVDDKRFRVLRDGDTIAVFDVDDNLLLSTRHFTRELAPFIADLIDFKFVLANRDGEAETPPPAYAFLPFYIDQDGGWTAPLNSFSNLAQYPKFRKPLLEFHLGILPNEYYELDAEKRKLQLEQREMEADRRVVEKALERFDLFPITFSGLEFSAEGHEEAIERLLKRVKAVREVRQVCAVKLSEVLDQRMLLEQQVEVVRASIAELEKDVRYAGDLPEEIFCPTCGTVHHNDFANRYGILEDREACFEFLSESRERIRVLASQAEKAEENLREADRTLIEIQEMLSIKRGDVSLMEVIESRGRSIAAFLFFEQLDELDALIYRKLGEVAVIDRKLEQLKDKTRRNEIVMYYAKFMVTYLKRLDVTNYKADAVTKIPARLLETGSDLPRALLAYFLAILSTIHKFSTSVFAPIVIDSPNQQDQDAKNVGAMIDLIINSRPDDAQTIMGTVSLHGREILDGKVIEFTEKLSVLRANEFEEISDQMQPYLDKMVA
jgi:hypothetical protein